MESRSDNVLMQTIREGDVARLAILFERYQRPLFSFFWRLTANREASEDLVQDVFFRILKYRQTFHQGSQFVPWMYQIARHAHLDSLQKRKAEVIPFDERCKVDEPVSPEPDPGDVLKRRQEAYLIRRALAALPPAQREVLVLSRFQNLKYEQIAQILECEEGAVKVRVYRALKALGRAFFELAGEKAS